MRTFTSTELTAKAGEVLDYALASPVAITKYRRPCVVVLNTAEYERLIAADAWLKRIPEGMADPYKPEN